MHCSWELKKNYFIKFLSPLSFKKYFLFFFFFSLRLLFFLPFSFSFFFLSLIYSLLRRFVLGWSSSPSHAADPSHPVFHLTADPLAWLLRYPSCLASPVSQSMPTHSPTWPSMGPTTSPFRFFLDCSLSGLAGPLGTSGSTRPSRPAFSSSSFFSNESS